MLDSNFFENADLPKKTQDLFSNPKERACVYTASRLLMDIRKRFGLEAMEEYLQAYINDIQDEAPFIKEDADRFLKCIDVPMIFYKGIDKSKL